VLAVLAVLTESAASLSLSNLFAFCPLVLVVLVPLIPIVLVELPVTEEPTVRQMDLVDLVLRTLTAVLWTAEKLLTNPLVMLVLVSARLCFNVPITQAATVREETTVSWINLVFPV
jgi:hypothetical protein